MPGMRCVAPIAGFYVMPQVTLPAGRTDEDYVLGLLRATGVLCVYGSGFGMPKDAGYFPVVFLAAPHELQEIYGLMADFTRQFLANGRSAAMRADPLAYLSEELYILKDQGLY